MSAWSGYLTEGYLTINKLDKMLKEIGHDHIDTAPRQRQGCEGKCMFHRSVTS